MGRFCTVRPNIRGLIELRNEGFVQDCVLMHANEVMSAASARSIGGSTYAVDVLPGRTRCHARVSATNGRALASQRESNGSALRSVIP